VRGNSITVQTFNTRTASRTLRICDVIAKCGQAGGLSYVGEYHSLIVSKEPTTDLIETLE
jgi:hypothetical protein